MAKNCWDVAMQGERREGLYAQHRELLCNIFDGDGRFVGLPEASLPGHAVREKATNSRVTAWHSFAAFAGNTNDVRLGNAILRNTDFDPGYDFFMAALMQLWVRHRDLFEDDIRQKSEDCIAATGPGQMASPGYVGMNDNFAAMAVIVLVLAGEATNRPELVQDGINKMKVLVDRLDTHGTIAEFNSPTYTGISLCCLADIVNFAENAEARKLALRIEQQVWYDMCARFHPGTSQMGGPSSRSYMNGSCGYMHNGRALFHIAFGEDVAFLSPRRYTYSDDTRMVIHHNDPSFTAANGAWVAAPDYHPTDECAQMMVSRRYPFEVIGTASCAFTWMPDDWRHGVDGRPEDHFRKFTPYRFAPALLTTYHTEDYSLGTSSGAHACGSGSQHDAFFLSYRRSRPVAGEQLGVEDVRTAFTRYIFNDRQPSTQASLLHDEGRKTCVQKNNVAIVLYRPGVEVLKDITSMRVAVVLPLHCSEPDEVVLGDQVLKNFSGESTDPLPVFVRDGITCFAFRPLELTNFGRASAVTVKRVEKFLVISFFNYSGSARSLNFPYQAPLFVQNGFVCEVSTIDEAGGFDAFRERVAKAVIEDTIDDGIRTASYRRDGVDLKIAYDPTDESVVTPAWIDGSPRGAPRFSATGLFGLPW